MYYYMINFFSLFEIISRPKLITAHYVDCRGLFNVFNLPLEFKRSVLHPLLEKS